MRAGRGIVHSERTSLERRRSGQRLFGIQTWMALPTEEEESDPAFVHHGSDELPVVDVEGVKARIIAGEAFGARSPLRTASQTLYADVQLAAGARVPLDSSYEERALYTIGGEIEVAGDAFGPGQLLVLRPGDPIVVRAKTAAQFMLFGGAAMEGPRYIWWNFVSSRPERIDQAKEEWAKGRFDTVPGDAEEFIPLPKGEEKPRRATGGVFYP
jgi:redox-sensitive bicupin YhaK (pirin superfamily)